MRIRSHDFLIFLFFRQDVSTWF